MGFTAHSNLNEHDHEGQQPRVATKRHPIIHGLIAFLQSPFWINPIQSFIDENCLFFDGEEENCLELTQVHERFRELIENLLEFLLGEMHVSHEEFVKVLMAETNDATLGQALEHIMAMDDYLSFRKIMERRNLQLECEALDTLKKKVNPTEEDDEELRKVLELSKREHEELMNQKKTVAEKEEYDLVIGASLSEHERELAERQRQLEQAELEMAIAISLSLQEEQKRRELEEEEKHNEELLRKQVEEDSRRQMEKEKERLELEERQRQVQQEQEKRKLLERLEQEKQRQQKELEEKSKREEERLHLQAVQQAEEQDLQKQNEKSQQKQEDLFRFNFTSPRSDETIKEEMLRIQKERDVLQKLLAEKEKQKEEDITKEKSTIDAVHTTRKKKKEELKEAKERLVEKKKQEREEKLRDFKSKLVLKKQGSSDSLMSTTSSLSSPSSSTSSPKNSSDEEEVESRRRLMREALSRRVKEDLLRQSQPLPEIPTKEQPKQFTMVDTDAATHLRSLLQNVVRNLKNEGEEDYVFSETK
ncbi:hypothetical protein C9374_000227 [Naegleria lovaniensis]|uniref:Cilia- and flagella-associated protein 36 n=1 Tax=Naegleria lovaniensis TaxID=51637 RepID=A0AA88GYM7_NAELO|nr:uncharacterized protein C9374_000227 [Naegleria lovaniensis]KAG2388788.1 hypothetical protein C9374_000227 [Naegleria lovaniensis]